MQLTIYELVVLNSMNYEVYRYQSEERKGVEDKLEELKSESGEAYKILTYGVTSTFGEYTNMPEDIEMKVRVEKLNLTNIKN
ncbi:hypothetical protein SHJJP8921_001152 [Staphylococcus lugdunensis]|uniref:hypothetical protein n=1 Tax=Staphylococcus lugdunensis TaxID=28035 RepID=UPI001F4CCEB8|nr:hypothetical protein [Staphylococcus lugdunensis]MCH8646893.1 hypothetical protein [Staphylococcus lugdunensis]